ncbi:MAG: 3-octaprenyl-4-hydroxybenzoate carboxy-lyase, partial [Saprospiraceae bacterium]|nr:3-octaprenyl-4-hydroxybenzoate carboxy-lyase [Saprospiraceae bacterium]
YMPFRPEVPEEILIQANHILGSGQTSLAKFLIIADQAGDKDLHSKDIPGFLKHVLERIDLSRDLHFQTKTTIDTLDYSGSGWNSGSKVIMACRGPKLRTLGTVLPRIENAAPIQNLKVAFPGVIAVKIDAYSDPQKTKSEIKALSDWIDSQDWKTQFPWIVLVDDPDFVSDHLNNFIWVTFTRINPSHDISGVGSFVENKHWGCIGPLILDARIKPHHAPVLETDKSVVSSVDELFKKGGPLEDWG